MTLQDIRDLLAQVADPEIPVLSIADLGILRDVQWAHSPSNTLVTAGTGGTAGNDNEPAAAGLNILVTITPTYSGCPAVDQIATDIRDLMATHGITAQVRLQLSPAWTTDWMGAAARETLRRYGIAPPHSKHPDLTHHVITFAPKKVALGAVSICSTGLFNSENPSVACPRCGSLNTTETSHFGSTACKSLHRCLACLEPFDHFKTY